MALLSHVCPVRRSGKTGAGRCAAATGAERAGARVGGDKTVAAVIAIIRGSVCAGARWDGQRGSLTFLAVQAEKAGSIGRGDSTGKYLARRWAVMRSTISGCFRRWRFPLRSDAVDGVSRGGESPYYANELRRAPFCRPDTTLVVIGNNIILIKTVMLCGGGKPFSAFHRARLGG